MKCSTCIFLASLSLLGSLTAFRAPGEDTLKDDAYRVVKKEVLGGDGSWDYLTIYPETQHLYIARESKVTILDMLTFKVVKEITGLHGVHGVALVPEFNKLFISNGRSGMIGIYDLKTLDMIGETKAGDNPDAIIYDSASQRIFAFNNGGTTATVLDVKKGDLVGTVELGGAPEFAVSDLKGRIYVNIEDKNEVLQLDTSKLTVLNHWSLNPGKTPTGLAIDLEHRRLFSACRDSRTLEVMDADNGKILASLPIGAGVDGVAFDPKTKTVFTSNGDGTLTVIREDTPDKYQVIQNVTTSAGARTMALDMKNHQIWLVTAETKAVSETQGKRRRTVVPETFSVITVGKD